MVFFLNRYFEAVGGAIAEAGGIANQYTGDGVMALFGVEAGAEAACRQALRAAGAMVARVEEVSRSFGADLEAPLRLGIGIHTGPPSWARWATARRAISRPSATPCTSRAASRR